MTVISGHSMSMPTRKAAISALAYMVRAVTPGSYTVPAVQVEDMYAPEVRGRGGRDQLTVAAY